MHVQDNFDAVMNFNCSIQRGKGAGNSVLGTTVEVFNVCTICTHYCLAHSMSRPLSLPTIIGLVRRETWLLN